MIGHKYYQFRRVMFQLCQNHVAVRPSCDGHVLEKGQLFDVRQNSHQEGTSAEFNFGDGDGLDRTNFVFISERRRRYRLSGVRAWVS